MKKSVYSVVLSDEVIAKVDRIAYMNRTTCAPRTSRRAA